MERRAIVIMAALIVSAFFFGTAISAETKESKQAPKKAGVLDKIKKAYADFKNRGQRKQAVKVAPAPARKAEAPKPKEAKPGKAKAEMSKEELLADLKGDLTVDDEIFDTVPGLKAEKDKDGKISYTYNGLRLEDMSKEELEKLSGKVGQIAVKIRTENIQRQLEIARQGGAGGVSRGVLQTVPAPPRPPQQPTRAQTPTSVPKTPSPPPGLPTRR